jgi:hypothetical protein
MMAQRCDVFVGVKGTHSVDEEVRPSCRHERRKSLRTVSCEKQATLCCSGSRDVLSWADVFRRRKRLMAVFVTFSEN